MKNSRLKLAYAAGIIDGEGTITLANNRNDTGFRHPVVSVSSTSQEILKFMKENYGGSISKHKTYKKSHKTSYSWKITFNDAIDFLFEVKLFLKEKEKLRRCKLIVGYYRDLTPKNGKYSSEIKERKLKLQEEFFHPGTHKDIFQT
jgi:hypothetical protein